MMWNVECGSAQSRLHLPQSTHFGEDQLQLKLTDPTDSKLMADDVRQIKSANPKILRTPKTPGRIKGFQIYTSVGFCWR